MLRSLALWGRAAMAKSTLTVRYQTIVPKEVREKLGLRADDELQWEISGDPPPSVFCRAQRIGWHPGGAHPYFSSKTPLMTRTNPATSACSGTEIRQICTLSRFWAALTASGKEPWVDSW